MDNNKQYPLNTKSPRQSINQSNYRGSYTMHLTMAQYSLIFNLMSRTHYKPEELWNLFFVEDYDENSFKDISLNAASEIIEYLKAEQTVLAFMRKISRTEQEQHEWEMYPDGKL